MIDTKQNMIIANNKIITSRVESCILSDNTKKYCVTFSNGSIYEYNANSIKWLKNPLVVDPKTKQILYRGKEVLDISQIYIFSYFNERYCHVCFNNNTSRDFNLCDLEINKSILDNEESKCIFDYLKESSKLSSLKGDDGTNLLEMQFDKLAFVDEKTALASYINPILSTECNRKLENPIFPFGCNASQFKAVKNALENKVSIIEGPPGTGKTQTILNIIANLLLLNETVQVVSNNNAAIENIYDKLASDKYKMDFLIATLGKSENKKSFIASQVEITPDLSTWKDSAVNSKEFKRKFNSLSKLLTKIFNSQEELAIARKELKGYETEYRHFKDYLVETNFIYKSVKFSEKCKSNKIMGLWQKTQFYLDDNQLKLPLLFKIKCRLFYGIAEWKFYQSSIENIICMFQKTFYELRISELKNEIDKLEKLLNESNANKKIDEFTNMSMSYLKNRLYNKYPSKKKRVKFTEGDLVSNYKEFLKEYPIVLSTTFSSRNSLNRNYLFDYVIMDEASQVDVSTGALALSSAKNAVIVGDVKQLPNVITESDKHKAFEFFKKYKINEGYNFANNSFLKSVSNVIINAPITLLREHYRCHPKIIDFCNQKFYNNELIIMTSDNDESDVLSIIKTSEGNLARGHLNQRQIDTISSEVLPSMPYSFEEIGIITPYNDQVRGMIKALKNEKIDIATVHKFQGREKEAIIISSVDDEITEFTDNPFLLNVAISRAKNKLVLIVSGNNQPPNSNLADLISYVEYNNFSIVNSELYSIFDYLYTQYTNKRLELLKKHKKVSKFDSENLMYILITDILKEYNLTQLKVSCHQPLNMLIRDPHLLNEAECKYAMNCATHLDFLIYNQISKKPILAIEVDGYSYHMPGSRQSERDDMKNHILELYKIPYLRFITNGSGEKERLIEKLNELIDINV